MVAGGLRLRISRAKADQAGQGAEIGQLRGRHIETCPVRAFEAWRAVAKRKAGPLFRKISTAGRIGDAPLHRDAVRRILSRRIAMAGITAEGFDRHSAHALRAGFITAAYDKGVRDEAFPRENGPIRKTKWDSVRCGSILPLALTKSPKNQNAGSVQRIGAVRQTSDLPHTDCVWDHRLCNCPQAVIRSAVRRRSR